MDATSKPAVVMDCGSAYSKLGFAGNVQPSIVIPTVITESGPKSHSGVGGAGVVTSNEVLLADPSCSEQHPVKLGLVQDWDLMERFWLQCVHQHLGIDPADHLFVVTEPPLNLPENRERTAEIMFETLGVPGLFIGMQATLALYASFAATESKSQRKQQQAQHNPSGYEHAPSHTASSRGSLTGTVIDAGDACTHIIPVVDGHVVGSSIKSFPVAGRDVTLFVESLLLERGEPVPPELSWEVAELVKEQHCYACGDMAKEFLKHEQQPDKYIKQYSSFNPRTQQHFEIDVGYERFMGPEVFFTPEVYPLTHHTTSLVDTVDAVIQRCPIDARRALYGNVVLSGGSTMFKDFGRRLQRDLCSTANARLVPGAQPIVVNVMSHRLQRYAAWFGGSVLASAADFPKACHTKAEYDEHGPSIFRGK